MSHRIEHPHDLTEGLAGKAAGDATAAKLLGVPARKASTTEASSPAARPQQCARPFANDAGLVMAFAGLLIATMGILTQASRLPELMYPSAQPPSAKALLLGVFLSLVGMGLMATGLIALSI
jgi:hypothetical protein